MPTATATIALPLPRPVRPGWRPDRRVRVLAGWYETRLGRAVRVGRSQIAPVAGWRYAVWEDRRPVGVVLYVRVVPDGA